LKELYSSQFQAGLRQVINPYGNGGASESIVSVVKKYSLDRILKKHFFDINKPCK
jgi:GDP/UDP-N,N'-diacetylbacillosamine 2-epimerase (hydrolysing)